MNQELPTAPKNQSLGKSIRNALRGILLVFRRERSFRIHVTIALSACLLAIVLQFTPMRWTILLLTIGFVMAAEALNTAIESLVDLIQRLDADPGRVRTIRQRNTVESLRRHDAAYRWRDVLAMAELPPTRGLEERLAKLEDRAKSIEVAV